jgi:hypothetical protein
MSHRRCSNPLESSCSTSTCVESPLMLSSFPLQLKKGVECSKDI